MSTIYLGNFAPKKGTLKYFRHARDVDTFYTPMKTVEVLPENLIKAAADNKWYTTKQAIGGTMSTSVDPHSDDIDDRVNHSLVYFPCFGTSYYGDDLWFFAEGNWYKIRGGDAYIFNSDKTHAVLHSKKGLWYYASTFVTKNRTHSQTIEL